MLVCDMILWYNTRMGLCEMCPCACGADRSVSTGFCGVKNEFMLARASLHFWEEPVISGENGSGTVFFSGCNMGCVFCQNREISLGRKGKAVSQERLEEIFHELKAQGANNINLVTPSHYTKQLLPLLSRAPLPVVWNSSAYEKVETLRLLENKVSIYLPDFKFALDSVADKYAHASDYPQIAKSAIMEMFRQTGKYVIKDGIMQSGVIVRHLILPENLENTYRVIDWVADNFEKGDILFSLMSQYTPYDCLPFDELNRRISKREYILARNYMLKKGIAEGFVQELSSAKEEYTPDFDLTGV